MEVTEAATYITKLLDHPRMKADQKKLRKAAIVMMHEWEFLMYLRVKDSLEGMAAKMKLPAKMNRRA